MWQEKGVGAVGLRRLMVMTAYSAFVVGLDRLAVWQVVRACVADLSDRALAKTSSVPTAHECGALPRSWLGSETRLRPRTASGFSIRVR